MVLYFSFTWYLSLLLLNKLLWFRYFFSFVWPCHLDVQLVSFQCGGFDVDNMKIVLSDHPFWVYHLCIKLSYMSIFTEKEYWIVWFWDNFSVSVIKKSPLLFASCCVIQYIRQHSKYYTYKLIIYYKILWFHFSCLIKYSELHTANYLIIDMLSNIWTWTWVWRERGREESFWFWHFCFKTTLLSTDQTVKCARDDTFVSDANILWYITLKEAYNSANI
jgi:hypothetical protein